MYGPPVSYTHLDVYKRQQYNINYDILDNVVTDSYSLSLDEILDRDVLRRYLSPTITTYNITTYGTKWYKRLTRLEKLFPSMKAPYYTFKAVKKWNE